MRCIGPGVRCWGRCSTRNVFSERPLMGGKPVCTESDPAAARSQTSAGLCVSFILTPSEHEWKKNDGFASKWIQKQGFQDAQDKQRTQCQLTPGQKGRCTIIVQKSEVRMPRCLDTSTKTQMAKIMVQNGRSSRSSWTKPVRSSSGRTIMGKAILRKLNLKNTVGKKFRIGNAFSLTERKDFSYLCMWTKKIDRKETEHWPNVENTHEGRWFGRTDIIPWPCFFLGCTQREWQTSKDVVDNCRNMFESRISAGATEKLPCSGKPEANISSWSYDMEGHAKKSVERYCELANKTTQQLHKVATPCIDDHQVKEEEKGSVGELSKVCSQIVLKSLYLARIGWPDILWSVKKLARAITKWTRACNKCLARVISYIRHTCEFKQYCHVGNRAQQCRLGLFQDSDFAGDLEGSKSASGWVLCIFGSHTFVPISWTCKKQTSVSHSSTGAEIISLDAEPTELLLIGSLTGLIWTQDSNQVCRRHQTSSCRHVDERKFHTWWVEQSSSFV